MKDAIAEARLVPYETNQLYFSYLEIILSNRAEPGCEIGQLS